VPNLGTIDSRYLLVGIVPYRNIEEILINSIGSVLCQVRCLSQFIFLKFRYIVILFRVASDIHNRTISSRLRTGILPGSSAESVSGSITFTFQC
jgi:hypothetical protein